MAAVSVESLLTSSDGFIRRLAHVTVKQWLNVELPRVQVPRVDLLGETSEGRLLHIELQSDNDSAMPCLLDIRELDGEALLNSPALEENILSVLTRLKNQRPQSARSYRALLPWKQGPANLPGRTLASPA